MLRFLEVALGVGAIGALVYFLRVVWRELGELDRLRQSSGRTGRRQS